MLSCLISPPASLRPRKIYNQLVPDVFPTLAPDPRQNVPKAVERKMEKLAEYLQKYPARTAKVSRRLTRRMKKELRNQGYGQAKIAVYTYRYLLGKSSGEESNFTFSYFTKELIDEPDAVIKTLLAHPEPMVRRFGAELLGSYIKAQSPVEHQLKAVEHLVVTVCDIASQVGREQELKLASLGAIAEYVGLCHELKVLPTKLEEVMGAVLKNLDTSKGASSPGVPGVAPEETTLHGLAHSVLLKFKPFLQDISTVYRVMETLFQHLDQGGGWQKADAVQNLMSVVQSSCSDQLFPLFAALIRHGSAPGLRPDERVVVINLALQQAPVYSLSAFSMALQELPRALNADQYSDTSQLVGAVTAAIRQLAQAVGDAAQLCEAISAVLRNHAIPTKQAQACLDCALAAVLVIPNFPEPGRTFPGGHAPAQLLQQLAAIITVWGPANPNLRATACQLLGAILAACGPGLRDEKQALGLMDMVLKMAQNVSLGTPPDAATMSRVLAACLPSRQPELLLHGVRLSKVLLAEALKYAPPAGAAVAVERVAGGTAGAERPGTGDEDADRLWAVALLMLVNNLLSMLASRANCNHLLPLRFNVPEGACTSLKEEGVNLMSSSPVFEGSASAVEACLRAVQSEWPIDHWYGKVLDALCKGSVLQTHYMHNLQNIIFEPFAAHAMPGLPPTQQLAAQPSIASGSGAAAQCASAHGRDIATQLSSKLEAMARNRVVSVKQERLNLQHVMDMLEDGDGDDLEMAPPFGSATAGRAEAMISADRVIITEGGIMDIVKANEHPSQTPLCMGPLEMSELLQRLEAVTG